jgi:hypothetical protein
MTKAIILLGTLLAVTGLAACAAQVPVHANLAPIHATLDPKAAAAQSSPASE